ncbi:MAG: hypothetical protein F6K04_21150, partial [Leptolyngbya sp. SIO4C5]|nr:hypothetical protein [Leptolyngbya sp. SIO4C5]
MIRAAWRRTGLGCLRVSIPIILWLAAVGAVGAVEAEAGLLAEPAAKEDANESSNNQPDGLRPFDEAIADMEKVEGLFTLYRNADKNKLYLALSPQQLNQKM